MAPYTFTESEVEEAALAWFAGLGYEVLSGPEIAPGEAGEERADYRQPFLPRKVRDALRRINPVLPENTVTSTSSLRRRTAALMSSRRILGPGSVRFSPSTRTAT